MGVSIPPDGAGRKPRRAQPAPASANPFDSITGQLTPAGETDNPFNALSAPAPDVSAVDEATIRADASLTREEKMRLIERRRQEQRAAEAQDDDQPGLLSRVATAGRAFGRQFVADPVGTTKSMLVSIVTDPIRSAENTIAPSLEGAPAADAAMRRIAEQRYGAVPSGWKVEGVTPEQRAIGAVQTAANIVAPGIGGVGRGVARNALAAGLVGAAYNPDDPAVGAVFGAAIPVAGKVVQRAGTVAGRGASRAARAVNGDVFDGALEAGVRGLAEDAAPPPITHPSGRVANAQFAADLEAGAAIARTPTDVARPQGFQATRTDQPRPTRVRQVPGLETTSEFAPPSRVRTRPVEGIEQPGDMLDATAREAAEAAEAQRVAELQAFNDAEFERSRKETIRILTGIRRRPGGVTPDATLPADGPAVAPFVPERPALRAAPEVEPTALPPLSREPLPSYPEGFTMGDDVGRIPDLVPERRPRIQGEAAPGQYLDAETARRFTDAPTDNPFDTAAAAPGRPPLPPEFEGVDPKDVRAFRKAIDAENVDRKDYRTMTRESLVEELQREYDRLDDLAQQGNRGWTRYDDDIGEQLSGNTLSGAIAEQQTKAALKRMDAIEGELARKYGVSGTGLADELQAFRERRAVQTADDLAGADTGFDFGANVANDIEAGPAGATSRGAARALPTAADQVGGINWRTWDATSGSALARVQDRAATLKASGAFDEARQPVTFGAQRAKADAVAKELLDNPLAIDRLKLEKLDAAEVLALKEVVQQQAAIVESASRAIASGELRGPDLDAAYRVVDEATRATDEALGLIVKESARMGRELGGLRQLAKQSLDPDVLMVHAKRLAGDTPLPDSYMLELRKLAREAAAVCAAGGT